MKPTLLILAAGMGARYGGLKQIDAVGPHGETIIDYCIYDAIRAGFGKLVFVIRQDFEEAFLEKVARKFDGVIETARTCQEMNTCLNGFAVPVDREKPWGTGHAILVAKDVIDEPFVVINADDYYGPHAFKELKDYLTQSAVSSDDDYAMVGYILRNTLSESGHVARGVCQLNDGMLLKKVTERTYIEKFETSARYLDEAGKYYPLSGDEIVSMNLWGFQPSIFDYLQEQFNEFLKTSGKKPKSEFYIPTVVDNLIHSGKARVKVLLSHDTWFGVTYSKDKDIAIASIKRLIEQGVYPEKLWP